MGGDVGVFKCQACGRRYPWREAIAGRSARCKCGQAIQVPIDAPTRTPEQVLEEVAMATPAPMPAPAQRVAKTRAASGAGGGELSLDVQLAAARASRRAQSEREDRDASAAQQLGASPLRDWMIPLVLLLGGVALLFVEAMSTGKAPAKSISAAVPLVALRLALKTALMLGGMFLAVQYLEVSMVGSRLCNVLQLCAIAIAPAAVKGLLMHSNGDLLYGPAAGVFASLAIYIVLFKVLLRTDGRDTAICVVVTWVLITIADYLAYKQDSMARGSWI